MDKLFYIKEFEDVIDWIERLEMAIEVRNYNEIILFKITPLNLKGRWNNGTSRLNPLL